jgi:hypothetical protein
VEIGATGPASHGLAESVHTSALAGLVGLFGALVFRLIAFRQIESD